MSEVIYGGYTDDNGNVVVQEMTNISGIQTMTTQVINTDKETVNTYVDKALDSSMKDYAESTKKEG